MVNLESLCIWIKYVERDEYPNHNIDYCMPLLKNLPSNIHLQLNVEDDPIENDYFYSFIKQFALKVSSLKVDFHAALDEFLHLDYGWVQHFRNLEKLVLEGYPLYDLNDEFDEDDAIEEFCQNPLSKLKKFQNPTNFYMSDKFLTRIHEAFPVIETLVNEGDVRGLGTGSDGDYKIWRIENLISVLQSLLSIENLTFSDHITMNHEYGPVSDLSLAETANIFAVAFDMIKQFPNDSIVIINENKFGYKIVKEKGLLPRIYHKICDQHFEKGCTVRWSYHTVCKIRPTRKKKSINTIIDFFLDYELLLKEKIVDNFNTEIVLIKQKDITFEETQNIFSVIFDIIKKFPIEICLKVVDDVHGYKIIKEEMKEPRIYHRICEKDCTVKFSYHTTCTVPEKPPKTNKKKATM
jgi:hypothetical protein